jgi:hypothetical protein
MPIKVPTPISNGSEENTYSVFDNRVLRRVFGPKREKGTGD